MRDKIECSVATVGWSGDCILIFITETPTLGHFHGRSCRSSQVGGYIWDLSLRHQDGEMFKVEPFPSISAVKLLLSAQQMHWETLIMESLVVKLVVIWDLSAQHSVCFKLTIEPSVKFCVTGGSISWWQMFGFIYIVSMNYLSALALQPKILQW